jgi:hypothetical protein
MGMTKADRQELDDRIHLLDYYRGLAFRMLIEQGMRSKRSVLDKLREEEKE